MNIGHLEEIGAALCDAILQFSFFEKLLTDGPRLRSQLRMKSKAEQCYPTLKHQHRLQLHQDDVDVNVDVDVDVENKVRVDVAVGCETKINHSNKMKGMRHKNELGKVSCDHDNLNRALQSNENSGSHRGEGVIGNTLSEGGEQYICATLPSFPSSSTVFSSLQGNAVTATAVTATDGAPFSNHSEDAGTYRIFIRLYNLTS